VNSIEVTLMAFVLILALLTMRVPLYVIMIFVPMVSALAYGGFSFTANVVVCALKNPTTWGLVLSVAVISMLVSLYSNSGVVRRLSLELSRAFKNHMVAITLTPGVLGLLPVPGGALMSAPLVEHIGSLTNMSRARMLFVNVWYRHVIVYVYPLSSVIILASTVTGVGLWELVARQVPVAIAMFLIGLPVVGFSGWSSRDGARLWVLARDMAPVLAAVVLALLLTPLDGLIGVERISVVFAVVASIALFVVLEGVGWGAVLESLRDRRLWELVIISIGVMVFRELFLNMDLKPIGELLLGYNVSGLALAVLLPILFSTISGHPTAGIAIATPIITSLTGVDVKIASLIYASAFIGYIASPLHLCYVYTAEYYKVPLIEGYKYMIPATIASLAVAITLFTML
jgi:integral membrane protein (TIGR00529 family)